MKTCKWTFMALVLATLAIASCGKQEVDTASLQSSFKSADAATLSDVEKVVASVKAKDYAGAVTQLNSLAKNAKLTSEQQQAIKEVMAQVQKAISEKASKAASDLQKSLPK